MPATAHSDTGSLITCVIKRAAEAYRNEDHLQEHWQALGFVEKPDYSAALTEYETFERTLLDAGVQLLYLPADDRVNMDSIYCRDASIATDAGMILCRMGKPGRAHEPAAQGDFFRANDIPVLGAIEAPGTLEGGDVAWLDRQTLAVGRTYRTNDEGIRQLQALLQPLGVEIVVAQMPHYRGPDDVFHLMSVFSPIDNDLAVVYSPLMPIVFRELLISRGTRLIEVPEAEWLTQGGNVLALGPGHCLLPEGNPQVVALLEAAGCSVLTYPGKNISVLGGGGPTCLTRPLRRGI